MVGYLLPFRAVWLRPLSAPVPVDATWYSGSGELVVEFDLDLVVGTLSKPYNWRWKVSGQGYIGSLAITSNSPPKVTLSGNPFSVPTPDGYVQYIGGDSTLIGVNGLEVDPFLFPIT